MPNRISHTLKKFISIIKLWLVLKKVHKTIKFDRIARLKPYVDMNTNLTIYKDLNIILKKIF